MIVKNAFTVPKNLKISHLIFALAMILVMVAINQFDLPNEKLRWQKQHLGMRAIGDALLHDNEDARSMVPPIQQIDESTLRLGFDQKITIDPDLLVDLSIKHLHKEIARYSIVHVLDAHTKEVVYAFEMDHTRELDIPCLGRILPEGNYLIEVNFYALMPLETNFPALSFASASLLLTLFGFSLLKEKHQPQKRRDAEIINGLKLDLELFQIQSKDHQIELTEKEAQILAILLEHVGQLVTRDHLIQEVWLKQGIVTSRSLDMYISRLRKKLVPFNLFEIVNRHGKGYILKRRNK